MEIGSIYEIAPDSVNGCNAGSRQNFSLTGLGEIKKYHKKYCAYTASGREAIALALRSLTKLRPNLAKVCLLPAYMCDTVFFPFQNEGFEIHFYHVNRELEANEHELCALIEQLGPGLLFIHPYYGVDTWRSMRPLLAKWKRQGICIMEDVTQSYYLEGAGAEADYVIGSLRKWYPVPDGGFVVSDEQLTWEGIEDDREFAKRRLKMLMDKWEYLYGNADAEKKKLDKAAYLKQNRALEKQLDQYSGIRNVSNETSYILERTDEENAKRRRNDNYQYLYERLKDKKLFQPIVTDPQEDAVPLYFAIVTQNRDELQSFLTAHEIYAPVLWPIGKENEPHLTVEENYIYEHMLALPIDQRYGKEEMQRIVEVMEAYERQHGSMADGNTQIIGIRTDANEEIAMGHIMRCITIAGQLKKLGNQVVFFTADEYAAELLEQAKMDWVCLHSKWNEMEKEIPILREELKKRGCSKLLVDSYQAAAEYFKGISDLCKLIYIDDCFAEIYPVDMLINYNAYHVRFDYERAYQNRASQKKTKLLLGTAYVPLREEFQGRRNADDYESVKGKESAGHVLLSSGGGDAYHALAGILDEVIKDKEFDEIIFHTVVGKFHPNAKELKQLAAEHENIRLHYDVKNMAELMGKCNAAVSAAGTMLFELSAMQVPTVFFVSADNQQYDSEFFAREERMLFAGDIRTDRRQCIENILNGLKQILKDEKLCQRMKKELHEVTDGRGAHRIAEAIEKL